MLGITWKNVIVWPLMNTFIRQMAEDRQDNYKIQKEIFFKKIKKEVHQLN